MNSNMINFFVKTKTILTTGFKYLCKGIVWLFSDVKKVIIAALLAALVYSYFNYKSLERMYDVQLTSYNDTLTVYRNTKNELYAAKTAYIVDVKSLSKLNKDLADEVKKLKDHPIVVTKTKIEYVYRDVDATTNETIVYVDSTNNDIIYRNNFRFLDDWTDISGHTSFYMFDKSSLTHFDNISMRTDLTLDLIEKDNNLQFIAKSSNPNVQINNIDGYIVSPEKSKLLRKKFNKPWGVMIGVGPSVIVDDNRIKVYPALQLTVGYKFISF